MTDKVTADHSHAATPDVLFDHPPKETELGVYFAGRSLSSEPRHRVDGDRELWEIPLKSYWIIAAIVGWLVFCTALVVWFERPDQSVYVLIGIGLTAVAWIAQAVIKWFNGEAAKLNPLLVLDRARSELYVAGRAEPLSTRKVVEIISWGLSQQNEKDLGFAGEQTHGQVCALLSRDEQWQLVFLYHGNNLTRWYGPEDPARRLAKSLEVPFRWVNDVEIVRDLRPPNRHLKQAEAITRRFGKRKE